MEKNWCLTIEYSSKKHGWGYFDSIFERVFDQVFDQIFCSAGTMVSGKFLGWRDVDFFFSTKEEALEWLRVVESIMASERLTSFKARVYNYSPEDGDYVWNDDIVRAERVKP